MQKLAIFTCVLILVLGWTMPLHAQQATTKSPDCLGVFRFAAAGSGFTNGPFFDNRGSACTIWTLSYQSTGFSAVSIQAEEAPLSTAGDTVGTFIVWPSAQVYSGSLPLTTTTVSGISMFGYHPFVRVTLNSKTGTGVIYGTLMGWRNSSGDATTGAGGGGGGASAVGATGAAVPGNADYQGINVGGTLRGGTGVNPSGSVYAQQIDIASVAGVTAVNDAAIGAALTTNPVPAGCHNETSPTTIGNTQAGVIECDTSQRLITVGAGTAGTPAGGVMSVQSVAQVPGTGATNLGKAEDAVHTSGDTGVFVLGVRNDSLGTTFTNTNGDYSPVAVKSDGSVYVQPPGITYNATQPTLSDTNVSDVQLTTRGELKTSPGISNRMSLTNAPVSTTLTSRNATNVTEVNGPSQWAVRLATPAAGTQGTASIAAEASTRHIIQCIGFSATATTAPAATALQVNVRDGATGAGTVLISYNVVATATTGTLVAPFSLCGLNLTGTTNTAATIEFSASLTNLIQDVWMSGINVVDVTN